MRTSPSPLIRVGMALCVMSVVVLLSGCQSTGRKKWYQFWKRGGASPDIEQYFPDYTPDAEMPSPLSLDENAAAPTATGDISIEEKVRPVAEEQGAVAQELQTIYFEFDRFDIRPDMEPLIQQNARWLLENAAGRQINVEGHCDEQGTNEYNMSLSERRAAAVKAMLYKLGVDPSLMTVVPYGEERPAELGSDEQAWAKNRRVQFLVQY